MHADGKSTLASVSKWNSGKVNYTACLNLFDNHLARAFYPNFDFNLFIGERPHVFCFEQARIGGCKNHHYFDRIKTSGTNGT